MNYEKYLPIGTVVMLKNGKKRIMITGFCSVGAENANKVYDYSGCLYPEGFLSSNQTCLFDHDQIDKVYYLGYQDDEEKEFKKKLASLIEQLGGNLSALVTMPEKGNSADSEKPQN